MSAVITTLVAAAVVAGGVDGPSKAEIAVHIQHESGGNDWAVGDHHLRQKAYGPLQIRQPVCDDINRHYGTHYRAEQCRGNRALSIRLAQAYWGIYATKKRLGRAPTALDRAGIWNGGPNGHRRVSTSKYRRRYLVLAKQMAR